MYTCPSCQESLPDNAKFCPFCGEQIHRNSEWTPPRHVPSPLDGPCGIGGWLILVVIGLFGVTGICLLNIISAVNSAAYFGLMIYLILSAYGVICIVFMFRKSRLFPKLYIGFLSAFIGIQVLGTLRLYLMDADVSGILPDLPGAFGAALIWITYMLTSKRVKNTFVK